MPNSKDSTAMYVQSFNNAETITLTLDLNTTGDRMQTMDKDQYEDRQDNNGPEKESFEAWE